MRLELNFGVQVFTNSYVPLCYTTYTISDYERYR